MSTLTIRKKSLKTWLHTDSILGDFIISKFYFSTDNVSFQIVEQGQSKRVIYDITDITLYALPSGGTAETFTTITQLSLRLEELNYPAFQYDGQITSIANLIDAGTGVTITGDGTEVSPYVISATGGGGSQTLQQVMQTGRSYSQTVGDYTYTLKFISTGGQEGHFQLNTVNNNTGFGSYIELSQGNLLTSIADLINNKSIEALQDFTDGYKITTSDDSTSENFVNQLIVPIKTAETGISSFSIPNNKPAGNYTLATTDDIPTIDATPTDGSSNAVSSNGVFDALALRKKVIVSDVTSATVTGTTSLTLAKTYEVTAGTLSASGFLNLFMYASRTGASNSYTMGIYINTSNNFGTATLITSIATSGNFSPFLPFKAQYVLKNNLLIGGISNQTSGSNYVNSITQVSVACNNTSNSVWLFIGITPTNSGSSIVVEGVEILN
jgi:hypothetical protein